MTRPPSSLPVVNSFNEWDPLEEIIVGTLDGQCTTPWEPGFEACIPEEYLALITEYRRVRRCVCVSTECEPRFDAADISRCGRDLFFQRSQVNNHFAIEWLQRPLGVGYRVHEVEFEDDRAVHIDATFVPLAPGKML